MIISSEILFIRISITILFCLIGFFFPRNKIIFMLQAAWIIILTCFNTGGADWDGNEEIYNLIGIQPYDISNYLYKFISDSFQKLGANFILFNGVMSLIATLIIAILILKFTENRNIAMSLWMIYPLFDNVIQKRAYYALGIIVLALPLLFTQSHKFRNYFLFEIMILMACSIHTVCFFYLTLPFFLLLKNKSQIRISIILVLLLIIFHGQLGSIVNFILGSSISSRSQLYVQNSNANHPILNFTFWTSGQILETLIIVQLGKQPKTPFSQKMVSMNYWGLLLIPFYLTDSVFLRIFRGILLFNYILISKFFIVDKGKVNKRILFCLLGQIFVSLLWFGAADLMSGSGDNNIIVQVLKNNSFLNW